MLAVLLLHPDYVATEPVFAGDLMALGEVVDLLILVESFIDVGLAAAGRPEEVPLVTFCMGESVCFAH
jgi:hypothetical protein